MGRRPECLGQELGLEARSQWACEARLPGDGFGRLDGRNHCLESHGRWYKGAGRNWALGEPGQAAGWRRKAKLLKWAFLGSDSRDTTPNRVSQDWIAWGRRRVADAYSRSGLGGRSQVVSQQVMANAGEERSPAGGAFVGLVEPWRLVATFYVDGEPSMMRRTKTNGSPTRWRATI